MDDNKFLTKLSQNLLEILVDEEYYDITIEVGNDPYVKVFRAHMVILNYRSPYLRRILSTNKKKNDGILAHIKLPNILPETFQIILRYIYGGRLSLEEYDVSDIIKILIAANELILQEIITHLQSFLIENKKNCIRHENFQMSDVQVWEYVLKWGISQNPELSSDPSSYSKDDFNTLKNTLQQCIPFIRFYNLTSKEFLNKVYPYKKVIPKELLDNLFKIITFQHAELISKWIDKLEITDDIKNSYEFKLILRGSRDGFSPHKFHEICDNRSHTISIIKVQGSNEILGGYNPIEWKSIDHGYSSTYDSFIFSFKSIENYILSRVKKETSAIFHSSYCGPSFGSGLVLCGTKFYNHSYCRNMNKYPNYEKSIREIHGYFSVEEYEVFQIIKD
ncbi:hypothetical protein RclHR1_13740006 [Rhizophagus clarus]|uniref:BTB domain-containing protein n=1 Tax=Rhizophagus clarus TaxID=94130 RepID=A0A2Z6QRH1_9GLOM|nr:hypothetical protein RclHR1_13740006 [Rhizophagus clarus]